MHAVWNAFRVSLQEGARGGRMRQGRNFFTDHAPSAYLCAGAAVEAFVNEFFISEFAAIALGRTPISAVPRDWVERIELPTKLVLVPQLIANRTLERDRQPYQDMVLLHRLRNELTHYKMAGAPGFVAELAQRGIALRRDADAEAVGGGLAWAHQVSTTEGIRWAYNTAADTARALVEFLPKDGAALASSVAVSFKSIGDADLVAYLREFGIEDDNR
jgi:hypothetical protein